MSAASEVAKLQRDHDALKDYYDTTINTDKGMLVAENLALRQLVGDLNAALAKRHE